MKPRLINVTKETIARLKVRDYTLQVEGWLRDCTNSYPVYKRLPRGRIFVMFANDQKWRLN